MLFEQGQGHMRQGNPRLALQDFYRVWSANPAHPHVRRFAAATGEELVLGHPADPAAPPRGAQRALAGGSER